MTMEPPSPSRERETKVLIGSTRDLPYCGFAKGKKTRLRMGRGGSRFLGDRHYVRFVLQLRRVLQAHARRVRLEPATHGRRHGGCLPDLCHGPALCRALCRPAGPAPGDGREHGAARCGLHARGLRSVRASALPLRWCPGRAELPGPAARSGGRGQPVV